ncbi:lipid A biosynthesis lauroyl acyltransferase [Niveispirillum irakense]|uniref:lipid A biosynthesis lauroyl acyltransferase n=1 Tax=Niveispirillum irakense TaxID=34011 RepID=UPI00040AC446|nr:lipid A biosynthesis lauroyl acyltransferase [Niveispirillum irakense]
MANHSQTRRKLKRLVLYRLEAAATWLFIKAMRLLSPERASDAGGWLMRVLGPRLPLSRQMRRNIARSLPELPATEQEKVLVEAWDNLGRNFAEYIHLDRIAANYETYVDLIGGEHLRALAEDGRPGIVFTGHFANWELCGITASRFGLELTYVFRRPNNPWVAEMLARARASLGGKMVPKGKEAARGLATTIRSGGHVGLLIDQKLNEGIPVPFLGRDAMTGTLLADLAVRYKAPAVPLRVIRLGAARFRVEALPPIEFTGGDTPKPDGTAIMTRLNEMLGEWVRERPGQWMWQHRRWPD